MEIKFLKKIPNCHRFRKHRQDQVQPRGRKNGKGELEIMTGILKNEKSIKNLEQRKFLLNLESKF